MVKSGISSKRLIPTGLNCGGIFPRYTRVAESFMNHHLISNDWKFEESGKWILLRLKVGRVKSKDISVEIKDDFLIVRIERRKIKRVKNGECGQYGLFERRISLPEGVDVSEVKTTYRWGVLTLKFPKKAAFFKSYQIPVTVC
jgi:HSP20 family molecular chaperone IbpA